MVESSLSVIDVTNTLGRAKARFINNPEVVQVASRALPLSAVQSILSSFFGGEASPSTLRIYADGTSSEAPSISLDGLPGVRFLDISDTPGARISDSTDLGRLAGLRVDARNPGIKKVLARGTSLRYLDISSHGRRNAFSLSSLPAASCIEALRGPVQTESLREFKNLSHLELINSREVALAEINNLSLISLEISRSNVKNPSGFALESNTLSYLGIVSTDIEELPQIGVCSKLRYLYIESNKRLQSLDGLLGGGSVGRIAIIDQPKLKGDALNTLTKVPGLDAVRLGLGNLSANRGEMERLGLSDDGHWSTETYWPRWLNVSGV